jgi:hypothetical protein
MYVHPERVNAQITFGTGMDVCCDMKWIFAASNWSTRRPYLTYSLSVNMRTFPSRGRMRFRILIARRVAYRYKMLSLIGLDALNDVVDGEEGGRFSPADIVMGKC